MVVMLLVTQSRGRAFLRASAGQTRCRCDRVLVKSARFVAGDRQVIALGTN